MKLLLALSLALLAGFAATARADLRLLASATSDSYQSLTCGFSAFCQASGFPFALTEINDNASNLLLIPNLAGIDVEQHFWLYWLTDDSKAPLASDVVSVAILPTADNAAATRQALANVYPLRTEDEEQKIWSYALQPARTGAAPTTVTPAIYVAVRHGAMIVSDSKKAAVWAVNRPLPTPPAGVRAIAGQIRFDIQPPALAALLAEGREHVGSGSRRYDVPERVLADIRTLTLVLETTTDGITADLSVAPKPGTPLARLLLRTHAPANFFWRLFPDQATVAFASGGAGIWQLPDVYCSSLTTQTQHAATVPDDGLTGDCAVFIDRTSATGGLYYAEILGITNRVVAWAHARADPQALLPFHTSFQFVTNGMRTVDGTPVLDLVRNAVVSNVPALTSHNPADMAGFMVRDGGVSVAATRNALVVTFGASNAIEQVLQRVANTPTNAMPLPARCRKLLPDLPEEPCAAVLLQPAGLVRQIAASLPGLKPERVADLPRPGDGIAAAITRNADGALRLQVRVSANEVSRFNEITGKGQAALKEMFMQMALQQMLELERTIDNADPRNPKP